ncbi:unnamed protein product [Closterium sp. NIES-65]|nr:unnamed protein product [Closterium sp. NIES-65]
MALLARPQKAGLLALCLLAIVSGSTAAPLAGPKCKNRFPKYPLCKFVNDMASSFKPTVVDAASGKTLQISAYQIYHKFHRDLPATKQYAYGMDVKTASHGGEQASDFDGHPDAWFTQFGEVGPTFKSRLYRYGNQQSASLIWFHDHTLGWTRLNTVAGLAGAYIIVDPKGDEKNLEFLPQPGSARYVPLVLADRSFFANGSIDYPNVGIVPNVHPNWVPEYFGNHLLVNGVVWPYLKVRRALYRFRVLGGSNARVYNLKFTCAGRGDYPNFMPPLKGPSLEIIQIGSDGGYLAASVRMSSLLVLPGERMDILVDFNGASAHCKDVILTNDARAPYPAGEPADANTGVVMRFVLTKRTKIPSPPIPSSLVVRLLFPPRTHPPHPRLTSCAPSNCLYRFPAISSRAFFLFPRFIIVSYFSPPHTRGAKQSIPKVDMGSVVRVRYNTLVEIMDAKTELPIRVTIDGKMHHDPATEIAKEGTAELWNIINLSADAHAMHLHLIQHRAISRRPFDIAKFQAGKCSFKDKSKTSCYTGPAVDVNANERGWKDTTLSQPGEVLTIYTPFYQQSGVKTFEFDASRGPGYVWHCHMLEHEENDMMRPLIITKRPAALASFLLALVAVSAASDKNDMDSILSSELLTVTFDELTDDHFHEDHGLWGLRKTSLDDCELIGKAGICDRADALMIAEGDLGSRLHAVCAAFAVTHLTDVSTIAVWPSDEHMPHIRFADLFAVAKNSTGRSSMRRRSEYEDSLWVRSVSWPIDHWRDHLEPTRETGAMEACEYEQAVQACLASLHPSPAVAVTVERENLSRIRASHAVLPENGLDYSASGCVQQAGAAAGTCTMSQPSSPYLITPSRPDWGHEGRERENGEAGTAEGEDGEGGYDPPFALRATEARTARCRGNERRGGGGSARNGSLAGERAGVVGGEEEQGGAEVGGAMADERLECTRLELAELFALTFAHGLRAPSPTSPRSRFVAAQGTRRTRAFRLLAPPESLPRAEQTHPGSRSWDDGVSHGQEMIASGAAVEDASRRQLQDSWSSFPDSSLTTDWSSSSSSDWSSPSPGSTSSSDWSSSPDTSSQWSAPADTSSDWSAPADTSSDWSAPADTSSDWPAPADTSLDLSAPADTSSEWTAPSDSSSSDYSSPSSDWSASTTTSPPPPSDWSTDSGTPPTDPASTDAPPADTNSYTDSGAAVDPAWGAGTDPNAAAADNTADLAAATDAAASSGATDASGASSGVDGSVSFVSDEGSDSSSSDSSGGDSSDEEGPLTSNPSYGATMGGDEAMDSATCNIYEGEWVWDEDNRPAYNTESCPFINSVSPTTNCLRQKFGRQDHSWMRYSWKPKQCGGNILRFQAADFAQKMQNKVIALVGDSLITEGFMPSLLCQLAQVGTVSRVEGSALGNFVWRLDSHNVTVTNYWSPFLMWTSSNPVVIRKLRVQDPGLGDTAVNLGAFDPQWFDQVQAMDLILFQSATHWPHAERWLRRFFVDRKWHRLDPEPNTMTAYKQALNKLGKSFNAGNSKRWDLPVPYFLSAPPRLVNCQGSYAPANRSTYEHMVRGNPQSRKWFPAQRDVLSPSKNIRFVDITHPSLYRSDAMLASQAPESKDCLHPCLPGLPDIWVDLFYEGPAKGGLLQRASQGLLSSLRCRFSRGDPACTDATPAKGKAAWRVVEAASSDGFVRRVGRQLWLRGKPFYVNGWNTYWLMYIASIPDKKYLVNQALSQGRSMGLTVCRTGAFYDGPGWHALQTSPGVFDENTFKALDYVIFTAKRFGIRLHMVLNGNWDDYGGKNQYVKWSAAAGGNPPADDTAFFVDPLCRTFYKNFIKAVLTRRNKLTGQLYRDDPTIFGWELMNEPRVYADPSGDVLQAWITDMAAHVKSLDPNHLLSIGSEGFYGPSTPERAKALNAEWWMMNVGTDFVRNNKVPGIDIASVHAYANSSDKLVCFTNFVKRHLEDGDGVLNMPVLNMPVLNMPVLNMPVLIGEFGPESIKQMTSLYSVSAWSDKLAYFTNFVKGHLEDGDGVLNMPVLIGEFGPESIKKLPDGSMARRNEVYSALYQIVLDSVKKRGSAGATMFWQIMADDLRSWDDGIAVFASNPAHAKTVSIISAQSKAVAAATRS